MPYAPKTLPKVTTGNVVLPSGYNIVAQAFSIDESQATENVTPFGENTYTRNIGSGTPDLSFTVSGFAYTSNPGFGAAAATNGDMGASATFTIATGITIVCPVVISRVSISESRIRAGVPVSISGMNAGEVVTTWTGA